MALFNLNIPLLTICCSRVVSLILCHDKPKMRAKQIERFADIANRLRNLNNYSALRAVVAGINGATYDGDEAIAMFKSKNAEQWKIFQSFDHLLQTARSHQRYRMALRNTSGACIPALYALSYCFCQLTKD